MQPVNGLGAPRRDPAPSRAAYRLHRLWLTPLYRRLLRVGLPAFLMAMVAGIYLSSDARRAALVTDVQDMTRAVQDRPEFMVTLMAIDGASAPLADAIRNVTQIPFPVSSFQLDLPALRAQIEQIDAVKRAELRVRAGGVLQVDVTERVPVLVWRIDGGLFAVDEDGYRIAQLTSREARADLPLIAGAGADLAVPEAMAIMAAATPILPRVRGLVRMGERRWDMILDRGQSIELPATDAVRGIEAVIALDKAEDILARDIDVVDMRILDRPTLRLSETAAARFRGTGARSDTKKQLVAGN
ncbi:cell division protein FtsQ/DivIB [Frigidibacter sp. MR17.14]|uniref:cell division protein FtsQ/DivIB n=1 Tax=Frigidibacter sp. MR17.14 TaxID=3126509 RepID=UPI003012DFD9